MSEECSVLLQRNCQKEMNRENSKRRTSTGGAKRQLKQPGLHSLYIYSPVKGRFSVRESNSSQTMERRESAFISSSPSL